MSNVCVVLRPYKMADNVNPYFENYDNEDCYTQDKLYEDFSDAVERDGLLLRFLPENIARNLIDDYRYELRLECAETPSIFICAIKQNGLALEFVPGIFKDAYVCQLALDQNKLALAFVPDSFKRQMLNYINRSSAIAELRTKNKK